MSTITSTSDNQETAWCIEKMSGSVILGCLQSKTIVTKKLNFTKIQNKFDNTRYCVRHTLCHHVQGYCTYRGGVCSTQKRRHTFKQTCKLRPTNPSDVATSIVGTLGWSSQLWRSTLVYKINIMVYLESYIWTTSTLLEWVLARLALHFPCAVLPQMSQVCDIVSSTTRTKH